MKDQEECQVQLEFMRSKWSPYHMSQAKPQVWVTSQLWSKRLDQISPLLLPLKFPLGYNYQLSSPKWSVPLIHWLCHCTFHDHILGTQNFSLLGGSFSSCLLIAFSFFPPLLGIEPRTLWILGHSTTELSTHLIHPFFCFVSFYFGSL